MLSKEDILVEDGIQLGRLQRQVPTVASTLTSPSAELKGSRPWFELLDQNT
ncbi:MAG: hypothetical protein IPO12_15200 [Flavobacteriales bacterium]|nr:hypothetical protein [Flavobacteriales bacterium]